MTMQPPHLGAGFLMTFLLALAAPAQGPADADYCNVALVPSLAAKLGLDLPLRVQLARKGAELIHRLRNGSGHDPAMSSANEIADLMGGKMVTQYGQETRDALPAEARRAFTKLFASRKVAPVKFWTTKAASSLSAGQLFLTFGWEGMTPEEVETRKSLRGYERWLGRCQGVISSADDAEGLLDHEEEDVQKGATAWLKDQEDPEPRRSAAEVHAEGERLRRESERMREESKLDREEKQRAWDAKFRARAAEREESRKQRELEMEASKARGEEMRRKREEMRARAEARSAETAEKFEETRKRLERKREALRDQRARHAKLRAQAEAERKKAEREKAQGGGK